MEDTSIYAIAKIAYTKQVSKIEEGEWGPI